MEPVFVTLVGTGATAPTLQRGLAAQLVQIGGLKLLVDCGEGTQVAAKRHANASPASIDAIFLTHFHADHWGGIPFLVKTRSGNEETPILPIYALADGVRNLTNIMKASHTHTGYEIIEIQAGDVIELSDDWEVQVVGAQHAVPACSFVFVERDQPGHFDPSAALLAGVTNGPDMGKLARGGQLTLADGAILDGADFIGAARRGRKIAISGDTRPTAEFAKAATNANLMIHESTFMSDKQARANKTMHSTAREAALTAVAANVRELWLTHLSNAYRVSDLLSEARSFSKGITVRAPRDGERVEVRTDKNLRVEIEIDSEEIINV